MRERIDESKKCESKYALELELMRERMDKIELMRVGLVKVKIHDRKNNRNK